MKRMSSGRSECETAASLAGRDLQHQYIVMTEAFMVHTKGAEALWAQPTMGRGQIKTSVVIAVLCICVYIKLSVHVTWQS